MDELLTQIFANQWRVIIVVSTMLLILAEVGFRFGLRLHQTGDQARKAQIATIQGAMLGVLGLLLGFTFAMAVGRYDARRHLVLEEANAIGTTYLRAAFLPEAQGTEARTLLRQYVDVRLMFFEAGSDLDKVNEAERDSNELQRRLWNIAVAAGRSLPSPLVATFVTSLNETIDLDTTRLAAFRNRVPAVVWMLLLGVAGCGSCAGGYGSGASGKRTLFATVVLPLLIAVIITLVADIDRPRRGLIEVSQQSLIDLKESFDQAP